MITPYFNNYSKAIVFSVDNKYIPLLAVAIQSIISNASKAELYDIVILYEHIAKEDISKILIMAENKKNINIRFCNISNLTNQYDETIFYTRIYFSKAAYYRLFIPEVFKKYEKIIYLDCDVIANCNINELFNINLDGNPIAACRDLVVYCSLAPGNPEFLPWQNYIKENILGLKNYHNYFQSAVMVFDVNKIEENFVEKAIKELKRIKKPYAVEQCILNVMFEDKVTFLDWKWNYNISWFSMTYKYFDRKTKRQSNNAKKHPKVIHFSGAKPYEYYRRPPEHKPFWKYAQKTKFIDKLNALNKEYIQNNTVIFSSRTKKQCICYTLKYIFTGEL